MVHPATLIDLNGRLPADAKPTLEVTNLDSGERRVFAAKPTGEIGRYTLEVVFPTPGRYAYTVTDGFTDREYTYPPVRIVGSQPVVAVPSSGGERSFPVWGRWRAGSPSSSRRARRVSSRGVAASGCPTRRTPNWGRERRPIGRLLLISFFF